MQTSTLSAHLTAGLLDFAWNEWAQMGVLATPARPSPWAQDPEALLLLTLEVARDDPRLFDEVLDWLYVNEQLISQRRLRSLAGGDYIDSQLVAGTLAWLGSSKGRGPAPAPVQDETDGELLFRDSALLRGEVDPAFASAGLLRPVAAPTGKSGQPDLNEPVNLAFRLRQLLGIGTRPEVVRILLTTQAPRMTVSAIARSAGYNRRNVQEALNSLHTAGFVTIVSLGSEQRYGIDRERWEAFLSQRAPTSPTQRDWPHLYAALRRILRWLRDPELDQLSDYLRASATRTLLEDVQPDFAYAGVPVELGRTADASWGALEATLDGALELLDAPLPARDLPGESLPDPSFTERSRDLSIEVEEGHRGGFTWRAHAANGRAVAIAGTDFVTEADALESARYFLDHSPTLQYDTYRDSQGETHWVARDGNGRHIAMSADSFSSQYNARRALERLRTRGPGNAETIRHVVPNGAGGWDVQAPGARRASSSMSTQREARERAREIVTKSGGGEVVVHGQDGRIRDRDTVAAKDAGAAAAVLESGGQISGAGGPMWQLGVYEDSGGNYRWRLQAGNGERVATSGESFATRSNARRAAENFKAGANGWHYEIYGDAGGNYRWRAKAGNGQRVGASGESFLSRSDASRAAQNVAANAGAAAGP